MGEEKEKRNGSRHLGLLALWREKVKKWWQPAGSAMRSGSHHMIVCEPVSTCLKWSYKNAVTSPGCRVRVEKAGCVSQRSPSQVTTASLASQGFISFSWALFLIRNGAIHVIGIGNPFPELPSVVITSIPVLPEKDSDSYVQYR